MTSEWNCPGVSVEAIIFNERDELLLIRRGKEPFMGKRAFPGGRMDIGATAEENCARELKEETGVIIDPASLRLVGVYSDPKRDPRRHNISIAFLGAVMGQIPVAADDAKDAKFMADYIGLDMAFDHNKILQDALKLRTLKFAA